MVTFVLLWLLHGVFLATAAAATLPPCLGLGLEIRTPRVAVAQGVPTFVKVKVRNKAYASVKGSVVVRLSLPAGLVPYPRSSVDPAIVNGPNAISVAYWLGVSLPPRKGRLLKLRLRPCLTAAPGIYSVGGSVLVVNGTMDVTCLTRAPAPVSVRVSIMMGARGKAHPSGNDRAVMGPSIDVHMRR